MDGPTGLDVAAAIIEIHQPKVHPPSSVNIYRLDTAELWCTGCSMRWPCASVKVIAEFYPAKEV